MKNNTSYRTPRNYMNVNCNNRPKCGDLWMCDLGKNEAGVQSGYRPVFIVSNDKNNMYSSTVNVIPLTTKINKRNLPIHIQVWDYEKYGLDAPSTIMVEQITTVNMNNLDRKIGQIDDTELLTKILLAMETQMPVIKIGTYSKADGFVGYLENNAKKHLQYF